jgi:ABC-type nitrate/sulfonate/bicarbonate transport system substrate-binding protein
MKLCWSRALILGATAALLAGCGGGSSDGSAGSGDRTLAQFVRVVLDGRVGPANVGVRLAADNGYFSEVGFEAETGSPVGPNRPTSYVTDEVTELGVTQLPQLLVARDKGMPLVAVGSLVPQSTAAMIWLKKSNIDGISDLRGKTIAIPGVTFQEGLLEAVLRHAGLKPDDVTVKPVGYDLLSALLGGKADAIFGGSWNIEGAALEALGVKPVITPVKDLGVPAYDELVMFTRSDFLAENPDWVHRTLDAVIQGVAAEQEDPRAAAKVVEQSYESSPELSPPETQAAMEATVPLLTSTGGQIDAAHVRELARWMHKEGLIRREPSVSEVFTNDYLPSP